jgi:hypothetical protein
VKQQPSGRVLIAIQFGQRVRRATVCTSPMDIGSVMHEQLKHWDVPPLRGNV